MERTVETGAVTQRPADIRRSGSCPRCGTAVAKDEDTHDCVDAEAEVGDDTDANAGDEHA